LCRRRFRDPRRDGGGGGMSTVATFEAVISVWDEQVRCEMPTQGIRAERLRRSRRLGTGAEPAKP
jgi:hypothetical protein